MRKNIWEKNFTIIVVGTIISAFGQSLVSFALSLVVFDQTQSALMSGIFSACTMIPMIVVPLIVSPYMDSHPRRPFIFGLDYVMGFLYIGFSLISLHIGFHYTVYLILSLFITAVGSVYQCAYQSLYPDLIPEGYLQKGFAVSSMIYPLVTFLMTPLSAILYTAVGIEYLFMIQGMLLIVAASLEAFIKLDETKLLKENKKFELKQYLSELKEGYDYLKEEKGIRSLYLYMAVTNGTYAGGSIALVAFFQTSVIFTTTMYSIFVASQTVGRLLGGFVQYITKVNKHKKYWIANFVYKAFSIGEMLILFLPFYGMLITQVLLGVMGVTSMTLRESAVQLHIPANKRARVYGLMNITMYFFIMIFRVLAGIFAEFMTYRSVYVLFAFVSLLLNFMLVDKNKKEIEKVVNVDC